MTSDEVLLKIAVDPASCFLSGAFGRDEPGSDFVVSRCVKLFDAQLFTTLIKEVVHPCELEAVRREVVRKDLLTFLGSGPIVLDLGGFCLKLSR